jgi:hypothetical protein
MHVARRTCQGIMALAWWMLVIGVWNWIVAAQANSDSSRDIMADTTTPFLLTVTGAFIAFFACIGFLGTLGAGSIWRSLAWSLVGAFVGFLASLAGGLVEYALSAEGWLTGLLLLSGPVAALVVGAALDGRAG